MAGKSTISITFELDGDAKSFKVLASSAEGFKEVMTATIKESEHLKKSLVNWSQGVQAINAITETISNVSSAFSALSDKMKGIQQENLLTSQLTGKTGEEMTKLRNAVKATADHFGEDFGETMRAVNSLAKGFGITAEEALQLVRDGFVSGANANGEFVDTLKEYPRYFKEAGLSAEQFVAITTNAAKQGIYSDKGVDVIKEGNLRIREMTKATADAMDEIGISAEKVQEGLANGSLTTFDVMQMVSAKLAELPASSAAVGTAIADIFGGPGEDAGLEYIKTLATVQTSMSEVKAAAGEMALQQEQQIATQENIKNSFLGLIDVAAIYTNVQPYVDLAAQVGMAAMGIGGLIKTIKAMNVQNAIAKIRIVGVSVAQRLLAASSVTATAGTWALNAAVTALYATLTLGISAAVTGLVMLFTSMGDEAETAGERVDKLAESTDAFNSSAAEAKTAIDMELVALSSLIHKQSDATEKVAALNAKYGEAMGHYETAAEWYDTLVSKSRVYCQQIGYEAQMRVQASQIAEKELARDALKRRELSLLTPVVKGGKVKQLFEVSEGGRAQLYEVQGQLAELDTEIAKLQQQYDTSVNKMLEAQKSLSAGVAETQTALNWQQLNYTKLGKAIEQQKKKVGNLVGNNAAEAKKEAKILQQMEARYKKWGAAYGLSDKGSKKDPYNGTKLINNAKSYKELGNNIAYYQKQLEKTDPSETAEIARLSSLKAAAQKAQNEVKELMTALGRPTELQTLEDYDKELAYLREVRKTASRENLLLIDEEIRALEDCRMELDQHSKVLLSIGEIKTYEQLEEQLALYENRLKKAGSNGRKELLGHIQTLQLLRAEWDLAAKKPEDISKLGTMKALSDAIGYYNERQQKASGQELLDLTRTKLALEGKLEVMKRLTELPAMAAELEGLDSLSGKALKLELEVIGLEGFKSKIRDLQKILSNTKQPLVGEQRKEVERLIASYKNYENALKRSQLKFTDAWGAIKGISGSITSMTDALKGNGNAWQTVVALVDGFIGLYNSINTIVGIINLLSGASLGNAAAKGVEATAEASTAATRTAAAATNAAAATTTIISNKLLSASYKELAASEYMAAHAYIPFAGFGIAMGFTSAMLAAVTAAGIPMLAEGGIASGPTLAMVGEYAGASGNPEVIAPLNKLRSMLDTGNDGVGRVEFKIEGRTLVGILQKENNIRHRS